MKILANEKVGAAGLGEGSPARKPPEGWAWIAVTVLAAFYFITSVQISGHRLLWFDEIITVWMARLPGPSRIVEALAHVDNNMPAPYFLIVHWFFKLFGESAVAARLPSTLALIAGLFITFDCARRLTNGLHGLVAVCVLACSCLPYYGFEARSYGIYFMLAAFCFWIWVHGKRTIWSAVLFGAAIFFSILVHYYAVLGLVPYAAWEALQWKRWRLPSAKLIAGGLAACCAAVVLVPQMSGAKRYSAFFWSPPAFFRLRATFSDLFPDGLFLLAPILIWLVLTARNSRQPVTAPMQPAECIGWLGFLIPFAGYVVAREITNAYVSRYFLGLLPGAAVAFSCWLWRHYRETPLVATGIFLILAGFGIGTQLDTLRHPESIDPFKQQTATRQALAMEKTVRAEGKYFTLLTNGMLYLELRYYAKRPEEYALLIPSEQYRYTDNTARYTSGMGLYYPMQFWSLDDLRKHRAETAVLEPTEDMRNLLRREGFYLHRRFAVPQEVDYLQ